MFCEQGITDYRTKKKRLTDLYFELRGHQMPPKNREHNVWCATNKKLLIVPTSLKNRQLQISVLGDEFQAQTVWQPTKVSDSQRANRL